AHLKAADPARTVAVISTTEVPTGQMVVDPSVGFPAPSAVRSAGDSAAGRACYLDAAAHAPRFRGGAAGAPPPGGWGGGAGPRPGPPASGPVRLGPAAGRGDRRRA